MYSGNIPHSVIRAETGERVQVPTGRLRQCIDNLGLNGRFKLTVDSQNKFVSFVKV